MNTQRAFLSLLIALFFIPALLLAQPVVNQSYLTDNLNKPFRTVLYETDLDIGDQLASIISATGANQVYDFSGLEYVDSTVIFQEYATVDPGDQFLANPNLAGSQYISKSILPPVDGGLPDTTYNYLYGSLDNGTWFTNGGVSMADIDTDGIVDTFIQWFSPPTIFLQFPLTINSFWTDSTTIQQDFMGAPLTSAIIIDTTEAEGWGTLITPRGQTSALRIKSKQINRNPFLPGMETISTDLDFGRENNISASIVIEDGRAFHRVENLMGTTGLFRPPPDPKFNLGINYPNPVREYTTIPFSLEKARRIKISIMDLTGRELEVLENRTFMPGSYETTWNPSGMKSGQYLIEMRAGHSVQFRKIILQD